MITRESIKDLSFEASLKALEEIISTISTDKPDLEKIIDLYQDGILYLAQCRVKLKEAEARVEIIGKNLKPTLAEIENGS